MSEDVIVVVAGRVGWSWKNTSVGPEFGESECERERERERSFTEEATAKTAKGVAID